jgi:DNA-binding winged helix-turn-helix (wHTH) protein/TolB-like protein/Flp pilus assembly protein TadD
MAENPEKIYEFGNFRLNVTEQILLCDGESVALTPKVFDLLVLLIENHGHLMEKKILLEKLWQDSFVEEANLNVNVSALRRALGEKPNEHRFIETVPRRGYRFVAEVREIKADDRNALLLDSNKTNDGIEKDFAVAELTLSVPQVKRCPKCLSVYTDEKLKFCRNDGEPLEVDAHSLNRTTALLPKQSDIEIAQSKATTPEKPPIRNLRLWLLLGGLLIVVTTGIVLWKFAFTSNKTSVSNIRTIAVLPFKPLVNNQTDAALEMGMADALITKLSSLQQITVRPTSAITKYSEANADPITAGSELQVEAVLVGRLQRADNKIRVTVQLLRVNDGVTLWAGSFDDFFTNIFAMQDSISEKVTSSLTLKLSGTEEQKLAKRYTENTEAYELYLQGQFYHRKGLPDELVKSMNYYKLAIEKDPNYVLPYSAMAIAYTDLSDSVIDREKNREKAKETAAKAISLDPESSEANLATGVVKYHVELNIAEADEYFRKAIEINPRNAEALLQHADCLYVLGRLDESFQVIQKARSLDPLSVWINTAYVDILINAHRLDEALEAAKKNLELDPRSVHYRRTLARVYSNKGMYAEAIDQHLQDVQLGGMAKAAASLGYIYAKAGRRKEAEMILQERLRHVGEPSYPYYGIALIYAGLGDKDKAFEWLEKSYKEKENLMLLIKTMPEWEIIRSDPRYQDLITRLKL